MPVAECGAELLGVRLAGGEPVAIGRGSQCRAAVPAFVHPQQLPFVDAPAVAEHVPRARAVGFGNGDGALLGAAAARVPAARGVVGVGPGQRGQPRATDLLARQRLRDGIAIPDRADRHAATGGVRDAEPVDVGAAEPRESEREAAHGARGVRDRTGEYVARHIARGVAGRAFSDRSHRRRNQRLEVEAPAAAVGALRRLQRAAGRVRVGESARAIGSGNRAACAVDNGDGAAVAGVDTREQQRVGRVVRVTHPIAEAVGGLRGHQEHVLPTHRRAGLLHRSLLPRSHPVEAVAHALRRDGKEPLPGSVLHRGQATDLPVAVRDERVAVAVGRRGGVGRRARQQLLRALTRDDEVGALPVVGGAETDGCRTGCGLRCAGG